MSECVNCGRTDRLIHNHHISYERDETVPVCQRCHTEIHMDEEHELYPEDERPGRNLNVAYDDDVFDRLEAIKEANGGSWAQNVEEAFEALAEQNGIDIEEALADA